MKKLLLSPSFAIRNGIEWAKSNSKRYYLLLLFILSFPIISKADLYIWGGATCAGWDNDHYHRSPIAMVQTDANTFIWVGTLTNGSGTNGQFKFCNNTDDLGCFWATSPNFVVTSGSETTLSTESADDKKFRIAPDNGTTDNDGVWKVIVKTNTLKMTATKLTEPTFSDGYYLLNNLNDYYWYAGKVTSNNASLKAKLKADLTFSDTDPFFPIACDKYKYKGEFDGGGHTIDGIKVSENSYISNYAIGFIRYATVGANVHDLCIGKNSSFEGQVKVGGIIGFIRDNATGVVTLTNVVNAASVNAKGGYKDDEGEHTTGYKDGREGNAAGLFACATDGVPVTVTNCANLGNVSGQTGQCAAFAGWTQRRKISSDPDVYENTTFTNCWNSGTIYNTQGDAQLYRNSGEVTATNCYDASASASRGQGTLLTVADAASGNLCFLLNGKSISGINWYQTMGTDNHPFPFSSHGSLAAPTATDGWYEISTPWQLYFMANGVNESNSTYGYANIKLTADIDYTQYTDQASMFGKPSNTYKGTFDGQYHTVTVAFNNTTAAETGLFRRVNGGTIQNLKVDGNVTTNQQFAGGIVSGIWQNGTIKNCISAVKLTDTNESDDDGTHGGILGWVNDVDKAITVSNCLFIGEIDAPHRTGCTGVVGWTAGNTNVKVNNCLVSGTLNLKNADSNGVISRSTATYSDNYYTCDVSGSGFSSIKKNNGTEASAKKGTGELCYLLNGSSQGGTNWTQSIGTDDYPIPFNTQRLVYFNNPTYSNTFIKDGKYQLATASDLVDFSALVNGNTANKGANAELTNDIDMDGIRDYTPIGTDPSNKYCGTFDGKGHRIKNLKIDTDTKEQGLFSVCENATIKNLIMDASCSIRCTNTDNYGSAAFVAVCNGSGTLSFINCGNEASVYGGKSNNAAFLGFNHSSGISVSLTNCYNTGAVSGGYDDCAMIGWNGGNAYTMTNCYNIGTISNYNNDHNTWGRSNGTKNVINCYSINSSGSDYYFGGDLTSITSSQVESGELCFNLKGNNETNPFTQDLSLAESHPTFGSETVGRGQWLSDDYVYYNIDADDNITVYQELTFDDTNTRYNVPAKVTAKNVKIRTSLSALANDDTTPRWNTFCSPVELPKSYFSQVKKLSGVTENGDNYTLSFTDETADNLEAGKPYMVQVASDVNELTVTDVEVCAAPTLDTFDPLSFHGTFAKRFAPLNSFIISNNAFYRVDTDSDSNGISEVAIKAFRGYISEDPELGDGVKALNYVFEDDADGIESIQNSKFKIQNNEPIYNLAGQRIQKMQKGINIVNGRKVLF